jgi:hypothetical protein
MKKKSNNANNNFDIKDIENNIFFISFKNFCYNRHNVDVNQQYDSLPYSFHLEITLFNVKDFIKNHNPYLKFNNEEVLISLMSAVGHDLIEDTRTTYQDIIKTIPNQNFNNKVAEVIFLCTEFKGRNREERKSTEFYVQLVKNKVAVLVQLADIYANWKYSFLKTDYDRMKIYKDDLHQLSTFIESDSDYYEEFERLIKQLIHNTNIL